MSKRTVQLDIQFMRSDKLGYLAPIEVYEKKFYRYAEPGYTITEIPLTETDLDILSESMTMLRQFKDFSLFAELNGVIQKLEDKIYREAEDREPIIHIEKNEDLKGLEHLDTLYQAILKRIVLKLTYQSFSARNPGTFSFHGYILKEFNNRWFVVGRKHDTKPLLTLALDRISQIEIDLKTEYAREGFSPTSYYQDTFGVTVFNTPPAEIQLWVSRKNAPYVLTKPFHHSQHVLETKKDHSVVISLSLHLNFELERLILGFGDGMEVLKPASLRKRIRAKLIRARGFYE